MKPFFDQWSKAAERHLPTRNAERNPAVLTELLAAARVDGERKGMTSAETEEYLLGVAASREDFMDFYRRTMAMDVRRPLAKNERERGESI